MKPNKFTHLPRRPGGNFLKRFGDWTKRIGGKCIAASSEWLTLLLLSVLLYRQVPGIAFGLLAQAAISGNLRARRWRLRSEDQARVIRSLSAQARTDRPTGLLNKAVFEEDYIALFRRNGRMRRPFGLLWIDIDKFANHNNTLGHDYGDQVIVWVAEILKMSARGAADLVGRVGGDEFSVALDGADKPTAVRIAERILIGVAAIPSSLPIRVSIGVGTSDEAESAEELEKLVDKRLYRAKAANGDQVVTE